jgi:hypothetical protein
MAMIEKPHQGQINEYTIKFLIGSIAFALPWIELIVTGWTGDSLQSISASYTFDPWPRNIFVGCLFAMAAFLLAYNGDSMLQFGLAKAGAAAAFCLAMFPCECSDGKYEIVPHVHLIATIVMFAVLIAFCIIFYSHAQKKFEEDRSHVEARRRRYIYLVCGIGMGASTVLLLLAAACKLKGWPIPAACPKEFPLVLVGETAGLVSFGIAWLTASKCLPLLARDGERDEKNKKDEQDAVARPGRHEGGARLGGRAMS